MAKRLQLRRGTTAETNTFTGAVGEVTVDTNKKTVVVHDGVTAGGFPVAAIANNNGSISLIRKDGTVITTISSNGLFSDTLTSTTTDQALTAAQGKVLQDNKLDKTANAVSASKLATARTINGTSFDGTADIDINRLISIDDRTIKPNATPKRAVTPYFASATGLTTSNVDWDWGDLLVLNSYADESGGNINAIWFGKNTHELKHYYAAQEATTWGTPKTIAYTDSSISGNAATATKLQTARTINGVIFDGSSNITIADNTKLPLTGGTITDTLTVAVDDTAGAFKKLIQGHTTTTTDGGYLAVGNTDVDKGYVEIGTSDDADTEIIARKRGFGDVVIATVKILDQNNNSSFPGSITASGNVTAFSDARLKDNITKIPDALNKLNQLKGVTFNRIDTNDKDKRYVGLIAQDVQSVMPEAVNVNDDEINTLSVDYQGLVGLLVESIKELKAEIDVLKEKVK